MSVSALSGSLNAMSAMREVLEKEETATSLVPVRPGVSAGSDNLMTRNFFDADYKRSEYLDSHLSGLRTGSEYSARLNSMLGSLISQAVLWDMDRNFGGQVKISNDYVNGVRLGAASAQETNRIQQQEVASNSKRNMDEIQDGIEEKARQATAPTDADGQPVQLPGSGSTDLPMPEISGSGSSAPPPPVSGSGGQVSAPSATVPTPSESSGAAPTPPSLDVVV